MSSHREGGRPFRVNATPLGGSKVRFHIPAGKITVVPAHKQEQGFAPDEQGLVQRQAAARLLIGQRVLHVAYVNLDYRGWDLGHHSQSSRREITAATEWDDPTWDATTFHHLDYGIEFVTDRGETWGITWDSPNADGESIRLQRGPVSASGAVWDVTTQEPWLSLLASPISNVTLRYHPWPPGFFCTRVSLVFGEACVEILLGDRDHSGQMSPSANNRLFTDEGVVGV